MIDLPAEAVQALPVDELALLALQDLVDTAEWNEHNYLLAHPAPVNESVAEALAWLRGRGFIARTPGKSADAAIFVTAGGRQALARGLRTVRAEEGLGQNLHPSIEQRSRRQFLLGEYEQAVFVAMKAVEIRVRRLAGFGDEVTGVDLMSRAFRPEGPLADPSSIGGEQVGTMNLFQGAYAVLRNPAGHRDVDYDDVTEAAEAVVTASLLMRILDRVERRLSS
jgi:uncharacterized protein (TIGR02391 family)